MVYMYMVYMYMVYMYMVYMYMVYMYMDYHSRIALTDVLLLSLAKSKGVFPSLFLSVRAVPPPGNDRRREKSSGRELRAAK